MENIKAVIDIGTNSVRLLVAEIIDGKIKELFRDIRIVRLGEDVDKNHYLLDEAMDRACDALAGFATVAHDYGAKELPGFATSAVRDASNRDEFMSRVKALGIDVTCISGEHEGNLDFVANKQEFGENICVIDVGGGSTEYITKDKSISLNMGCVRCTEKFFGTGYTAENVAKLQAWINEQLKVIDIPDGTRLIGVAGTATTQISVRDGLVSYDSRLVHGKVISLAELEANLEIFLSQRDIVGLEPMRRDIVAAGTIIIIETMKHFDINEMTVSEADNLLGYLITTYLK